MLEIAIRDVLSGMGDLAAVALVFVMWKFDRRLVRMETLIGHILKRSPENGLSEKTAS
jgi:hypothetical protein